MFSATYGDMHGMAWHGMACMLASHIQKKDFLEGPTATPPQETSKEVFSRARPKFMKINLSEKRPNQCVLHNLN
jgi:hypothetical protein